MTKQAKEVGCQDISFKSIQFMYFLLSFSSIRILDYFPSKGKKDLDFNENKIRILFKYTYLL